jgi:hypothetical protein
VWLHSMSHNMPTHDMTARTQCVDTYIIAKHSDMTVPSANKHPSRPSSRHHCSRPWWCEDHQKKGAHWHLTLVDVANQQETRQSTLYHTPHYMHVTSTHTYNGIMTSHNKTNAKPVRPHATMMTPADKPSQPSRLAKTPECMFDVWFCSSSSQCLNSCHIGQPLCHAIFNIYHVTQNTHQRNKGRIYQMKAETGDMPISIDWVVNSGYP